MLCIFACVAFLRVLHEFLPVSLRSRRLILHVWTTRRLNSFDVSRSLLFNYSMSYNLQYMTCIINMFVAFATFSDFTETDCTSYVFRLEVLVFAYANKKCLLLLLLLLKLLLLLSQILY